MELDWKKVKAVDLKFLGEEHRQTDYRGSHILSKDDIFICEGYRYLTVVLDYETGQMVWVG